MLKLFTTTENVCISLLSIRNILEYYIDESSFNDKFLNQTIVRLEFILTEIKYLLSDEYSYVENIKSN